MRAADRIIAAGGFEHLTIRRLASAARVPVGSIYQYFPDKAALVEAVARSYIERFDRLVEQLVAEAEGADWDDTVEAVFGAFVEEYRSNPGYVAMWTGRFLSPEIMRADDENNERIADGLRRILVRKEGVADGPELRTACRVAVHAADALLQLAFRTDPAGDEQILREAKRILRSYLHDLRGTDRDRIAGRKAGGGRTRMPPRRRPTVAGKRERANRR